MLILETMVLFDVIKTMFWKDSKYIFVQNEKYLIYYKQKKDVSFRVSLTDLQSIPLEKLQKLKSVHFGFTNIG